MTIYTDQVTGKKYDRLPGGVAVTPGYTQGYKPCSKCAFGYLWDEACARCCQALRQRHQQQDSVLCVQGAQGMTHDGAYIIVIPMARWHKAANDDQGPSPLRTA